MKLFALLKPSQSKLNLVRMALEGQLDMVSVNFYFMRDKREKVETDRVQRKFQEEVKVERLRELEM